ncbi:hypothetical protein BROC_00872 [Candidatus Brocadiaceae bacterium]|nr:hypothetical protein BROC_00872 [Candidatus Brocadiaceae bacterium]
MFSIPNEKPNLVWLALVFLLALMLRLLAFSLVATNPDKIYANSDAYNYDNIATNLIRYHVFSADTQLPLTLDLERTPIYPGLLAVIFELTNHSAASVILFQILFGALTALVCFVLTCELGFSNRPSALAALIIAVDPLSILTGNLLITEILFTALLVTGIWLLVHYWQTRQIQWSVLSAILLALAALTRPISQFLPLVLVPLFFLAAQSIGVKQVSMSTVLFLVVSLGITYTWAWRNYLTTDVWTISSIGDYNLIYYRASEVLSKAEGMSLEEEQKKLEASIKEQATQKHLDTSQIITLQRQMALDIYRQYPIQTIAMHVNGWGRVLFNPGLDIICGQVSLTSTTGDCRLDNPMGEEQGVLEKTLGKLRRMDLMALIVSATSVILLGIIYLGAVIGVITLVKQHQWLALGLLLVLIGYFSILAAGAEAVSRFRIPFLPFLAILSAIGIDALLNRYIRKSQEQSKYSQG